MNMKLKSVVRALASLGLTSYLNLFSQRTYDAQMLLRVAATVAATDTGTLIVNLDGVGMLDGNLVLDITAMKVSALDEFYQVILQGSPDANFGTPANITVLATQRLGSAAGAAPLGTSDTPGRYLVPFRNERNGVTFRYLRLQVVLGGTAPSLSYTAWVAKPA
jgi:hypothetical protein